MLFPRFSRLAVVDETKTGWLLKIPAGDTGNYRLAQLDNYGNLPRRLFPLSSPSSLHLMCRASANSIPGTWGFGFWNDPFAYSLGLRGTVARLPAIPNACWFFHSSPENHLSLRDDLAGNGFLMQVFRSPKIPSVFLLPGLAGLPLLFTILTSRWLRALTRATIQDDSQLVNLDVTEWHSYGMVWHPEGLIFSIDEKVVFKSALCPLGPLGIVIWIDNQFAAWRPDGKIAAGTLKQNNESWLEIKQVATKNPF